MSRTKYLALATVVWLVAPLGSLVWADEPPAAPPVSKFAPADDLIAQVDNYVDQFATAVASADEFEKNNTKLRRDANTLVVIALGLALHDADHRLKSQAPAIVTAAQALAKAKDFDTAKSAVAAVQEAVRGTAPAGGPVKWERAASQGQLMKQVTFLANKLRRGAKPGPRFEAQADENARAAAVLAVIAQGVMADTHDVKDPSQTPQWYQYCGEFRDAAGALNGALHQRNAEAASAALTRMEQSCTTCHKVFRKEQL